MAVCGVCSLEMQALVSCSEPTWEIDGVDHERVRYGTEPSFHPGPWPPNCRDCGTPLGGLHHPGCSVERCPACVGSAAHLAATKGLTAAQGDRWWEQAISCDCVWAGDEQNEDEIDTPVTLPREQP